MNWANGIYMGFLRFFKINGFTKVLCLKAMIIVIRFSKVTIKTCVTGSRINRNLFNQLYFTISFDISDRDQHSLMNLHIHLPLILTTMGAYVRKVTLARKSFKSFKSFILELQSSKALMFFNIKYFRVFGLASLTNFNVS